MRKAKPKDKPLSENTILHYYTTLGSMLDKAVQWDVLTRNPIDRVDRPRVPKVKVNFLTEERTVNPLRSLKDEKNMSYRCAVLLALLCGLRLGEVGALRLSDVDFDEGTIDISRSVKYPPSADNFEGAPKTEAGKCHHHLAGRHDGAGA